MYVILYSILKRVLCNLFLWFKRYAIHPCLFQNSTRSCKHVRITELQWNGNIIFTKLLSLTALEAVKVTIFGAIGYWNFVKMTTFQFQGWLSILHNRHTRWQVVILKNVDRSPVLSNRTIFGGWPQNQSKYFRSRKCSSGCAARVTFPL